MTDHDILCSAAIDLKPSFCFMMLLLLYKGPERFCSVLGVLGDVESFSGFLRVEPDLEKDSQLFFWFVPKQKSPASGNS